MNLTLCLSHFLTTLSLSHNLFIHCCSSVLDIKCQSLCIVLVIFQKVKHVFHSWQIVFKLFYCSVFGVKIAFNVIPDILGHSRKSLITLELGARFKINLSLSKLRTSGQPTGFGCLPLSLFLIVLLGMLYYFSASLWVGLPDFTLRTHIFYSSSISLV